MKNIMKWKNNLALTIGELFENQFIYLSQKTN